jgi:DNA-binding response OmpR family regulator
VTFTRRAGLGARVRICARNRRLETRASKGSRLENVWGNRAGGNRQLLKQLVHRLRQKIEADPAEPHLLRTVPNAGYELDVPGSGPVQESGRLT